MPDLIAPEHKNGTLTEVFGDIGNVARRYSKALCSFLSQQPTRVHSAKLYKTRPLLSGCITNFNDGG